MESINNKKTLMISMLLILVLLTSLPDVDSFLKKKMCVDCGGSLKGETLDLFSLNVNCNGGNEYFKVDRSPNDTTVTDTYQHSKNVAPVSQYQNFYNIEDGSTSCMPSASASAIEYWNRTKPGMAGNISLKEITEYFITEMDTSIDVGTQIDSFTAGMTKWIARTGYAPNMSVTVRGPLSSTNNFTIIRNGVQLNGIHGSGVNKFPLPFDVFEEFVDKNEYVILIIQTGSGSGHAIALNSVNTTMNSEGNYNIAVMDPLIGGFVETELTPKGRMCYDHDDEFGYCRTTRLLGVLSVSMKND